MGYIMVRKKPLKEYRFTDHARFQMQRRQISEHHVGRVLAAPEQTEKVRKGRMIYQSRIKLGEGAKTYLIRLILDIDREPPEVVTVYRTSKIEKYWRNEK